jgi:hypothetical protein
MADEWRASRGRFCGEAHIRRSSGRDTESSSCASATPSDAARHSEPTSLVGRAEGWWFFGETAWGDQYAYAASDDPLSADQTVYRLDVCHLEPEPIADDFGDFVRGELTRNAVEPRDEMTVAARERLGDLDPNTQLAYLPSLMSGGEEDVANLVTLPARAAMVAAGMTRQNWALVATSMS